MPRPIPGIHHITVIAGDPQRNLDFYVHFLGLRLVKKTVNFDDPGTYHLYYGDSVGHPGSILTFFPWPGAYRGKPGAGEVSTVSFSVPEGSLDYWVRRAGDGGVTLEGPTARFDGERFVSFTDPDGLRIELVGDPSAADGWGPSAVPETHTIRGFHGAALSVSGYERTAKLLTDSFGFESAGQDENRFRFRAPGEGGVGTRVDLLCQPDLSRAALGAGSVHHIAWRTQDDESQKQWRRYLASLDYDVTPVMDRQYFHSIYFREPGGVLFEIATDPPGFTFDENADQLGAGLKLPPWLEPRRAAIERILPPLSVDRISLAKGEV
jgi:catechol 2,3-dioxygenase-like lactoylglutathione lyase family enzyme